MNNNAFIQANSDIREIKNDKFSISEAEEEKSLKEDRILHKLTLRKQKMKEILFNKRGVKSSFDIFNNENYNNVLYIKENFLSGKIYDDLKKEYNANNINEIKKILYGLALFLKDKKNSKSDLINILTKADSSYNIQHNIKYNYFPLASLVLEIGINTNDKIIYIYCFNLVLNFSFISNDFSKEITNEKNIKDIINRLIYFYPLFSEDNNIKINYNKIFCVNEEYIIEEAESYYFGSQIFKLLGNLYLSVNTYNIFKTANFYEKVLFLLYNFELDYENEKYLKYSYDYLDTLVWLLYIFLVKDEKMKINYSNYLLNIIPKLLEFVEDLYFSDEIELLEKIIFLIEIINDININFTMKLVESNGVKTLTNLFGYLFKNNNNDEMGDIKLTPEITNRIIGIFINIFNLDSKYLANIDFNIFILVFEKLLSLYKYQHMNYYNIQNNILILLSNIACFNNNEEFIRKIIMNNNIIGDLFKYYCEYHKSYTIVFIDNIMIRQNKCVRDFILNMGGFNFVKNNICNETDKNIIKKSIITLYDIISVEKPFTKVFFEKIYKTSIPDKIKNFASNENLLDFNEKIKINSFSSELETYETSLGK